MITFFDAIRDRGIWGDYDSAAPAPTGGSAPVASVIIDDVMMQVITVPPYVMAVDKVKFSTYSLCIPFKFVIP